MKNSISRFAGFQPLKKNYWNTGSIKAPRRRFSDHTLSADFVLENQPSYICSLNKKGVWSPLARGNSDYFKSIQTKDFTQWVSQNVPVADRVSVLKAVSDCRADRQPKKVEFPLQGDENNASTPNWVELQCMAGPSQDTIMTTLSDISPQKALEEEICTSRNLAEKSNVAKTRFLANMSHELRTPLNAIIGFSDILKSGMVAASDVEKQSEYHTLINESAHHLLQVLNDILDMSKIEAGKYEIFPEEIDVTKIISSVSSMLMPLARKGKISINQPCADEPVLMEADSRAVRQILINLISNAIKFSEPETEIRVSARRIGRKIEFCVADCGRGISPAKMEYLGQPFYQADSKSNRKHEGTGLGLSIVKGLIELHKGDFKIESTPGKGTTVTVRLFQSTSAPSPVPADDIDTIIKISPRPSLEDSETLSFARLVG